MNKKIYKTGMYLLSAQLLMANLVIPIENTYYTSFAEERSDEVLLASSRSSTTEALGEAVSGYGLAKTYNAGFASYLNKKGISKKEYESYIEGNKKYANTNVEKSAKAENLLFIFDVSIYTHPVVKSIYEQNVKIFKNKDTAWKNLKKGAIYDIEWLNKVFNESLDNVDAVKVYKYLFKKEPTAAIEKDLNDRSTLKYGLYSGLLKKELTNDERLKIKNGLGYELLGVKKADYEQYQSYSKLKERIVPLEASYIKEFLIHSEVRSTIKKRFGVDIYEKISDSQRLLVYKMSLDNFNYNKAKAEKAFKVLIKRQEEIGKPSTQPKPGNDEGISDGSVLNPVEQEKNPAVVEGDTIKDYDYLDKAEPSYGIFGPDFQMLDLSSKNRYTSQYYYSKNFVTSLLQGKGDRDEKYYVIKMNEKVIPTKILVEGKVSNEVLMELIEIISGEDDGKWKVISSEKEHLIFINNIIDILEIEEEYSLDELNKVFEVFGVKVEEVNKVDIDKLEEQGHKEG